MHKIRVNYSGTNVCVRMTSHGCNGTHRMLAASRTPSGIACCRLTLSLSLSQVSERHSHQIATHQSRKSVIVRCTNMRTSHILHCSKADTTSEEKRRTDNNKNVSYVRIDRALAYIVGSQKFFLPMRLAPLAFGDVMNLLKLTHYLAGSPFKIWFLYIIPCGRMLGILKIGNKMRLDTYDFLLVVHSNYTVISLFVTEINGDFGL